ncbi:hypothetical protein HYC85_007412 [Camellia sinensis]|uniref:Uncharacterized protein n=1 Tax=Camellia sinensis TaxID=4442 RepID=A0A7J7HR70_CAMSI|nr:hypothetical protein HYC85_007412 [Camellia sinensis]
MQKLKVRFLKLSGLPFLTHGKRSAYCNQQMKFYKGTNLIKLRKKPTIKSSIK